MTLDELQIELGKMKSLTTLTAKAEAWLALAEQEDGVQKEASLGIAECYIRLERGRNPNGK